MALTVFFLGAEEAAASYTSFIPDYLSWFFRYFFGLGADLFSRFVFCSILVYDSWLSTIFSGLLFGDYRYFCWFGKCAFLLETFGAHTFCGRVSKEPTSSFASIVFYHS